MSKTSLLAKLLGALDETNAALGIARASLTAGTEGLRAGGQSPRTLEERQKSKAELNERLRELQNMLFRIGADLSTPLDHPNPLAPRITQNDTTELEKKIDALDEKLPELRQFILPGGTETAAALHLARAIARRTERRFREAVEEDEDLNPALGPYLNRLSSYLFALARWENHTNGKEEEHPKYTSE